MYMRARANRESELAKQEAIRTHKMHVDWFFERKHMNREWQAKLDKQRRDRIEEQRKRREQEVHRYVLRNTQEIDDLQQKAHVGKIFAQLQEHGHIVWPAVMYDPVFDQHRQAIENVFKRVMTNQMHQKAAQGALRYIISVQPEYNTLQVLKDYLHRHRHQDGTNSIPAAHYIDAKRFLQSLLVQ